ncbi:nucleolar protein 16-like isoform X2 [Acanthaster planci]|uniref:Nucleolar protein 16 n=1 Tax=Acanthaster planci TaxID=133434 RepID=A0A8B7XII3_ACAPL|nr:nucleolar protein 16-like isoform X2 [Acanthaster planci]
MLLPRPSLYQHDQCYWHCQCWPCMSCRTLCIKPVKEAWDKRKSMARNLADMGLSVNPNKTIPIPKMKDKLKPIAGEDTETETPEPSQPSKIFVLQALEDMANVPLGRSVRISQPLMNYCIRLMEKYGEDYKAMARDPKNYYQDTPKQIRRKINLFKSIPEQYNPYIQGKMTGEDSTNRCTDTR